MAEIVNLRRVRKAKARVEAAEAAGRNRFAFGRGKAEREAIEASAHRRERVLDGHARTSGERDLGKGDG